jgi:hypothetical protein
MEAAYALLNNDKATLEDLTPAQQKLWNSFETDQIYKFLASEPDTVANLNLNVITVPNTKFKVSVTPPELPNPIEDPSPIQTEDIPQVRYDPNPTVRTKYHTPRTTKKISHLAQKQSAFARITTTQSPPPAPNTTKPTTVTNSRPLWRTKPVNYQELHLGKTFWLK